LDVKVWAESDRLRSSAPAGVLTPELREELANRKPEILAYLRAASAPGAALVSIQAAGSRRPFFGIPGHNGDVFCYVRLAHHLGPDQPFYALEPPGVDGQRDPLNRVEELAAYFIESVRAFQPDGPYLLGGYCAGGTVAFEMAQQLHAKGQEVAVLAMFEGVCPTAWSPRNLIRNLILRWVRRVTSHLRALSRRGTRDRLRYLIGEAGELGQRLAEGRSDRDEDFRTHVARATVAAVRRYVPRRYPGRIGLFFASEGSRKLAYSRQVDWATFAAGGVDVHVGPDGCHSDIMLRDPSVGFFAQRLRAALDRL
jgi:thioesterase domain-containing protein